MKHSIRCIVLGASAGGVESLQSVVAGLPADLGIPVFVVLHIPPFIASNLPAILTAAGPLPAVHPKDGENIRGGVIYVAPPDHHVLVGHGIVTVARGPKENRFRPSVDALFRSAAYTFGPGAIGVILSGMLDDGTSGLWSIKRMGGVTIIQHPDDARYDPMPRNALEYVEPDHLVASAEMGAMLGRIAAEPVPSSPGVEPMDKKLMAMETDIAISGGAFQKGIMEIGQLSPFTCPECHGALVKIGEGEPTRYRCHTGHGYTGSALLEGVMETTGEMLWQVIRSLEEAVMLLHTMGEDLKSGGDPQRAEVFFRKARELEKRSKTFHDAALNHESLSGDNLGEGQKS